MVQEFESKIDLVRVLKKVLFDPVPKHMRVGYVLVMNWQGAKRAMKRT